MKITDKMRFDFIRTSGSRFDFDGDGRWTNVATGPATNYTKTTMLRAVDAAIRAAAKGRKR